MKYIFPSLLQTANDVNSFSWFDIKRRRKKNKKEAQKKKRKIKLKIIQTIKFKLDLNSEQEKKLKLFLDDVIDVYNLTNENIKTNKLTKKDVIFYKLRTKLTSEIKAICAINGLHKHTADYSVKHCVEMYKSAFSNMKNNEFNIKNLDKSRRRKNLVIEPCYFSKKTKYILWLGRNDFVITI
jgi:type VI protein secretion system component VasA